MLTTGQDFYCLLQGNKPNISNEKSRLFAAISGRLKKDILHMTFGWNAYNMSGRLFWWHVRTFCGCFLVDASYNKTSEGLDVGLNNLAGDLRATTLDISDGTSGLQFPSWQEILS